METDRLEGVPIKYISLMRQLLALSLETHTRPRNTSKPSSNTSQQ